VKISELFYSLQGEGMLSGMPSVFIRLAGCNLRCGWCDTKYASWYPESEPWSMEAILEGVELYPTRYVVITGGEPTIHPELAELTQELKARGKHITIETNGTSFMEGVACDLISMSPKLRHSIADAEMFPEEARIQMERRWNIASFKNWIDHHDYQLKFVFTSAADVEEIHELVGLIDRPIPADRIMLMPEGIDTAAIGRRAPEVVEVCRQQGYRYCARLHIDLFGNTRGT